MQLNPFILVRIGEQDITELISKFSFEDCTEDDDFLLLSLQGLDNTLLDLDAFQVGKDIEFQFGYRGGNVSPLRVMRIADINISYNKTTSATLKALDYGQLLKKQPQGEVWQKKSASQIVTAIAQKYGLDVSEIQATSYIYAHLAQGQKTDFEFIAYLAERETNGSFHFYISNNTLFFKRKELNQEASQTFKIGENIISFKPALKDSNKQTDSTKTATLNGLTGSQGNVDVNAQNAKDQFNQGKFTNQPTEKKEPEQTQVARYDGNGKIKKEKK